MLPWLTMTCLLYCWSDRVDICVCVCHLCSFSPPLKASLMASTDHCNCRSNLETPTTTYLKGVFTFNLSNWDLPNVFQYHGNFHAVPSGDRGDQETGERDFNCIISFNNCRNHCFKDPFEWPATNFVFSLTIYATVSFCLSGNAPWFHFRFSSSVWGCGATTGFSMLGIQITITKKTRSIWCNCALRGDVLYWVSTGH